MSESRPGHAFVDFVRIHVKAGDGGHGYISFRREKGVPFGGPNGGDGGRGGSVWLEADPLLLTLLDFKSRPSWVARNGQHGSTNQCSGKAAEDVILKVPVGTVIVDEQSGKEIGDLSQPGMRVLIAKGGDGGRGNQHFATSTNKTPRKADDGWPGEERRLALELKVIADVGLVGLPNAGKSTLLAALTKATPKIAPYPFTTLSPNLGVMDASDYSRQIVIADIPGLIEGAHVGAGLGDRFLRHIERTRVLLHLIGPEAGATEDGEVTLADARPETLLYAWDLVENELRQYSDTLLDKPHLALLSKTDLISAEEQEAIVHAFRERGIELLPICARTGTGLEVLRQRIEELTAPPPEPEPIHEPTEESPSP